VDITFFTNSLELNLIKKKFKKNSVAESFFVSNNGAGGCRNSE
jgi:hypothetical protein